MSHFHGNQKPITINGITYSSHQAAARSLHLSPSQLSKQLHRRPSFNADRYFPLTIDGQTFSNAQQLADQLQLTSRQVVSALQLLTSRQLAITSDNLQTVSHHDINEYLNDRWYHNLNTIAHDFNFNRHTINQRHQKGMHDQSLIQPLKFEPQPHPVTLKGITYPNLKAAAHAYHIAYPKFRYRYQQYQKGNMTASEIFQTDRIGTHHYQCWINGRQYHTLKSITNDYSLSYHQIKRLYQLRHQKIITQSEFERRIANTKSSRPQAR